MSRISPAFHFKLLPFVIGAVLAVAAPALAQDGLRRLPISFERQPSLRAPHRLDAQAHRKANKRVTHATLDEGDGLARAANLLEVSGYTDIKGLRAEGDHVAADVEKDNSVQHLIVTTDGTIAEEEVAAKPGDAAPANPDNSTASPQADDAAGSTSDAASPGALSASSSTPR